MLNVKGALFFEDGTAVGNVIIQSLSKTDVVFSFDGPPFDIVNDCYLIINDTRRRILISDMQSNISATRVVAVFA